jgi:hypothetical protein
MPNEPLWWCYFFENNFTKHGVFTPFHLIEPRPTGLQVKFVDDRFHAWAIPSREQFRISPSAPNHFTGRIEYPVKHKFR